MEVGLVDAMSTYSGGLGVLAGDTLRAAADAGLPLVAMTLLHRNGYFRQRLDDKGHQTEEPDTWRVEEHLEPLEPLVHVEVLGKKVALRTWVKELEGVSGHGIRVYYLDSDVPENDEDSRALTDELYGGDHRYRLSQEALLGIGGVRMLAALGYDKIRTYHLNEGHSALLTLELITRTASGRGRDEPNDDDIAHVRGHCVFTTHTPVAAGHDRFEESVVKDVLGDSGWSRLQQLYEMDKLNLTDLGLRHSRFVNGVARKHADVTRLMFDGYLIESITNGVHAATWASPPFQELFDRHIPRWREDNQSLRYMAYIPVEEIAGAHADAKQRLVDAVKERSGVELDPSLFTIGFARRATAYKRADLLFRDIDRLNAVADASGNIQIVYAGKAHPRDVRGKEIIASINAARDKLSDKIQLVYLENYGIELGGLLTSGVDLWLNTPEPPKEASGTSGMKAALNGVPSLSVLDGWWIEGWVEGVTGWSIGDGVHDNESDARDIYDKLEKLIVPLYYRDGEEQGYAHIRRSAISLNGSFFNTERMIGEYERQAYRESR